MREHGPRKRLALDANLPLDLAAGFDFAHDFREGFQVKGYSLLLPSTAAEEIWLIHNSPAHPQRKLATKALRDLTNWGIDLLELKFHLRPVAKAIGRKFAERLILAGHLLSTEINDGIILAESAQSCIKLSILSL